MANDDRAEQGAEKETQQEPMPSSEQKTPESDADGQASRYAGDSSQAEGLPEGASDRTRNEFEKLKGSNSELAQQLREERARREYMETVFNQLQPKSKQQQEKGLEPIYDPETGLINEQALSDIQRKALEAERTVQTLEQQQKQFIREQENREAFTAYPELDPNGKSFDKKLHVETRRVLIDSMLNPDDYDGKQLSFKEAADLVKGGSTKYLEQAKKEGAKEAVEQLTPKEQAGLEATGTPGRRAQSGNRLEDLQQRTRRGDTLAVIERLERIDAQE